MSSEVSIVGNWRATDVCSDLKSFSWQGLRKNAWQNCKVERHADVQILYLSTTFVVPARTADVSIVNHANRVDSSLEHRATAEFDEVEGCGSIYFANRCSSVLFATIGLHACRNPRMSVTGLNE